jgi:hypothetical protein
MLLWTCKMKGEGEEEKKMCTAQQQYSTHMQFEYLACYFDHKYMEYIKCNIFYFQRSTGVKQKPV